MKFTVVAMFIAFYAAFGVEAKSVEEPQEKPTGHSSPINSGDIIALRSAAFTRGPRGPRGSYFIKCLECTKASCALTDCRDIGIDCKAGLTGLPPAFPKRMMFRIYGTKKEGVIDSGDEVSLSPIKYDRDFLLACDNSSTTMCRVKSTSGKWRDLGDSLTSSKAKFQIYSRDAEDGGPVENCDVVGFKYPYSSNEAWLALQPRDRHYYPLPCSNKSKIPCAAEGKPTGFIIYKKLRR